MNSFLKNFILLFFFGAIIAIGCKKADNELKWPRKLNQPASLTDKIWRQDTLNSIGGIEFIEFYSDPANVIKLIKYNKTEVKIVDWSYYPDQHIVVSNNEKMVHFGYYDCIISGNKLDFTYNETVYTFYNYP